MDLEAAIRERSSVKSYDSTHEIPDSTLRRLFQLATLSPSSFNLQHWRFVVVREPERKRRLEQAAYGQKHVSQASLVVVVCGKPGAHNDAARIFAGSPPEVRERLVAKVRAFYGNSPSLQRDEAIRSASLASMTLMLAAKSEGLETSPLSGFDPRSVAEIVHLDDQHFPVLLLLIGKAASPPSRSTDRLPLHEVVRLETLDGPGL